MQLEFHQLDRRWEHLRVRHPERQRRLLASLAASGQQTPIVVVVVADRPDRYLVIDGYQRIAALEQLGRDTVEAVVWPSSELDAVLLEHAMRMSRRMTALEEGWLLEGLERRFGYLRDPQLQRNVHRSQNRIESYHQLRAFIAEVSGKKHLTGRTDLDVAISNECGRLIANVVTAYNSILLSMLLNRCQAGDKEKVLERLKKISPVAWQHIHFLGHYLFRDNRPIDLEAILEHVDVD
jgi:uncharacterized ParB-like nuclease family protein